MPFVDNEESPPFPPTTTVTTTTLHAIRQNRVSKEALRRLARSWHLKSSAAALDRLTDVRVGVATGDPALCLAIWKAAAYLATENKSKTITVKFVDRAIMVNNILVDGCGGGGGSGSGSGGNGCDGDERQ